MKKFDAKGMACPLPVIETKKLLIENDVVETTVDNEIATQNLEKLAKQLGYEIDIKKISDEEYKVVISKNTVINTLNDKCVIPVTQAKRALETSNKVEMLIKDENSVEKLEEFANKNNYNFEVEKNEESFKVIIENQNIVEQEETVSVVKNINDESYIVVVNKLTMGHGSEELGKRLIKGYFVALNEQELLPKKVIFYNGGAELVDKNKSHIINELKELEEKGVEIVCCGACIDYHGIELAVGNPTNMYFIVEDMRKANRIIRP